MQLSRALLANHRFGMGARLGAPVRDEEAWLRTQLTLPQTRFSEFRNLPDSTAVSAELVEIRRRDSTARQALRKVHRLRYRQEAIARTLVGVHTDQGFTERLVRFFSDVFTVSTVRVECLGLVGAFEREVIRPGITGRFADLLVATTKHPAMLYYLDNVRSTGPDSRVGQKRKKGRNENLAREILELHTLGVDHYSQDDVISLANMLTGWSVNATGFTFSPNRHQPGTQTLLGVRYPDDGPAQAEAALRELASHPKTIRRMSWRMARHFLSDEPPESVIEALSAAWKNSDGDLPTVAAALVNHRAAWAGGLEKIRRPDELVIAALRATTTDRLEPDALQRGRLYDALSDLGQIPWRAPSPEGWPDVAAEWLGGDSLLSRLSWSWDFSRLASQRGADPTVIAETVLAGGLDRRTLRAIASAPDRQTGIALCLASPTFQRR